MGWVIREEDPLGNSIEYFYEDGRGNMTKMIETEKAENGQSETYTTLYKYNSFNKVEEVTDPLGQITTFSYDTKGNLNGSQDAEGNIISHEYENFGRKIKTKKQLPFTPASLCDSI